MSEQTESLVQYNGGYLVKNAGIDTYEDGWFIRLVLHTMPEDGPSIESSLDLEAEVGKFILDVYVPFPVEADKVDDIEVRLSEITEVKKGRNPEMTSKEVFNLVEKPEHS